MFIGSLFFFKAEILLPPFKTKSFQPRFSQGGVLDVGKKFGRRWKKLEAVKNAASSRAATAAIKCYNYQLMIVRSDAYTINITIERK